MSLRIVLPIPFHFTMLYNLIVVSLTKKCICFDLQIVKILTNTQIIFMIFSKYTKTYKHKQV